MNGASMLKGHFISISFGKNGGILVWEKNCEMRLSDDDNWK